MNSPFNIRNIISVYHSNIIELFSKIPGTKCLMLHPDVQVILDKICGTDLLKKCEINNTIGLTNYSIKKDINKIICLLPPTFDAIESITKMIKSDKEKNIERTMVLGFVPLLTESCRFLLQKEELPLDKIGVYNLKIGWIPIDDDILTFHAPNIYPSTFLHRNMSWCYFLGEMIADAIIVGLDRPTYTCQIYSLGEASNWCFKGVYDTCNRNSSNFKQSDSRTGSTNIFIFSRDLDYVTPFCLPITFEGMLHEVMDIDLGQVLFKKELTDDPDRKEFMNSNNSVFQEIRSLPLTLVVPALTKRNKELTDKKSKVNYMKETDQLYSFVTSDMPHVLLEGKQLKLCFAAYDFIIKETTLHDRVDDLMSAQASLLLASDDCEFPKNLIIEFLTCRYETKIFDALRLLCLWTAVLDGLPKVVYQAMYRLICHSAGYAIIYLLQNLRRLRLFAPREDFLDRTDLISSGDSQYNLNNPISSNASNVIKQKILSYKSRYFNIKSALMLSCPKQMNTATDCFHTSYIFGGHHTPICSALIEEICRKTTDLNKESHNINTGADSGKNKKIISPIDECFRNLNISSEGSTNYGRMPLGSGTSVRKTNLGNIETIIVCFVGGCCYSEITALRYMAKLNKWNLIILTSCILNTKSLIMQVASDN